MLRVSVVISLWGSPDSVEATDVWLSLCPGAHGWANVAILKLADQVFSLVAWCFQLGFDFRANFLCGL